MDSTEGLIRRLNAAVASVDAALGSAACALLECPGAPGILSSRSDLLSVARLGCEPIDWHTSAGLLAHSTISAAPAGNLRRRSHPKWRQPTATQLQIP